MIITIPPEALTAARAASMNALGDGDDAVKAACLAMLNAWPGALLLDGYEYGVQDVIHLPLPKEGE